ncbi:HNH endonuclease [Bacillus mycoides]|uniref:HNH endonuclease n=1 Tax=Bacillus mycoides TaxID=1405 RepID=UPI002E226E38|nr:HNH endonuclease [Bacillus mycoides]MED1285836.1 HNH endonuclease [Bacillus mycoides]
MRSLKKEKMPTILETNGDQWKKQYMQFINDGKEVPKHLKTKYSHPTIKHTLLKETKGKCAYCESSFIATDYGDIEHIEPKSKVPEKIFEWNNLTLACGKCNLNKRDYHDVELPLLNPYIDKPEEEIIFMGPMVSARSERALMTIKKLDLDRVELYERRKGQIDSIQPLIYLYATTGDFKLKEILYNDLLKYTDEDKEYTSMMKSIIRNITPPVPVEV